YENVPIGKPIQDTHLYILDENKKLLPPGVDGEIYLSGHGVAKGYHKKEELTKQKFLQNPFVKGHVMYKTGDTGRWLPDGLVEYTGRIDEQVKIRGYRIELEEVQHLMEKIDGVEQAVVAVKELAEEKHMIGYWKGDLEISHDTLKEILAQKLPFYSVPSFFIRVEIFPLNANGKIDKKALPLPESELHKPVFDEPETILQHKIYNCWKQVLNNEAFGITTNFFDTGGHSLKAMRLRSLFAKELGKELSLNEIFQNPTIVQQETIISGKGLVNLTEIKPAKLKEHYPLSFSQQRLWILSQFEEASKAYHMSAAFRMKEPLNREVFNKVMNALIQRHEILRTVFVEVDGTPVQKIIAPDKINFKATFVKADTNEIEKNLQKNWEEPFDLQNGPLLKVAIFSFPDGSEILSFNIHHLICDGWSIGVLFNEMTGLYNDLENETSFHLPVLTIQYKDFAVWQREDISETYLETLKIFWKNELKGEYTPLNMPLDFQRPSVKTYNGANCYHQFSAELTGKINNLVASSGGSLFMVLMSGLQILLKKYSNQDVITVGTPAAGRDHYQLENQIGFYVNTLAIRSEIDGGIGFSTFLHAQKEKIVNALAHQAYPFELLIDDLELERDLSRSPLFDVMLVLQNTDAYKQENVKNSSSGLQLEPVKTTGTIAKFDLTFYFEEQADTLAVVTEYNTDLFKRETIEQMVIHLKNLFNQVVTDPTVLISNIQILDENEKQLLHAFNHTQVDYKEDETIIDLLQKQSAITPNNTAVVFDKVTLSYKELDECSNQLADYLKKKHDIKRNDFVGVKLQRSEWMVVVLLGILKSGGTYVPIDPVYPKERIDYMIADSNCKLLFDEEELEKFKKVQKKYSINKTKRVAGPNDLAYIIYTSGSTGKAKGVMIEHRNVYAFINWCKEEFRNSNFDVVFGATSICFDLSVFELFYTLSVGKKIRIMDDATSILSFLTTTENVLLNTVPSVIGSLLEMKADLSAVKVLNMAGEVAELATNSEINEMFLI
ncbi:MAG TPA: condensation domain-containing protein, partial [Bacteroidia bacterium]|nr:condensation domain-containing protein [Bacteroidia bacterium]